MTVPRKRPRKQLPNTSVPLDVELTCPDNDPEPVPPVFAPGTAHCPCWTCPTCGRLAARQLPRRPLFSPPTPLAETARQTPEVHQ